MKLSKKSGAVLAATAAAMLLGGVAATPVFADDAPVGHCVGANACKGLGSCKTASNSCKGQASCKGQGWVSLTEEQCKQVGAGQFKWEKAAG